MLAPWVAAQAPTAGPPEAAPSPALPSQNDRPLGEILKPDGTLRLGTTSDGNFAASGWRLKYGEDDAPVFKPASIADPANRWSALGPIGEEWNAVYALAVSGNDLYVGGDLDLVISDEDHAILRWDGSAWHTLGDGLGGVVYTISVARSIVYAGGTFGTVGPVHSTNIAGWNGSSWFPVGGGVTGEHGLAHVNVIDWVGDSLYVGGDFTNAGDVAEADYIARWDGTWHAFEGGGYSERVNHEVTTIKLWGGHLYANGSVFSIGSNCVVRWDGSDWVRFDDLLFAHPCVERINDMLIVGPEFYIGGEFTDFNSSLNDDQDGDNIARWDGSSWHNVGSGLNGTVYEVTAFGPDVYLGGAFTETGSGMRVNHLVRWESPGWDALAGVNDSIRAVAVAGADLHVGGDFTNAGGIGTADGIARFGGYILLFKDGFETQDVLQWSSRFGGACNPALTPVPNLDLSEPRGIHNCPRGMTAVDTFCIDRWGSSLDLDHGDGSFEPWSPYFNPGTETVVARSIRGAIAQSNISQLQAAAACSAAGKRLCTSAEWLRACQGTSSRTYPYGNNRVAGACNDHRAVHPLVEYYGTSDSWIWDHTDEPCLNQLDKTVDRNEANRQCISEDGIYDMVGGLLEWTSDPTGILRGGSYADSTSNGVGCLNMTSSFATDHFAFDTGFRCCDS